MGRRRRGRRKKKKKTMKKMMMMTRKKRTGHDWAEPGISCDACPKNAVEHELRVRAVDARK